MIKVVIDMGLRCYYKFGFTGDVRETDITSISDVGDGFWVNDACKFTRGMDCNIWIPAHQVIMVKKYYDGE
jgi:hypothetical protein